MSSKRDLWVTAVVHIIIVVGGACGGHAIAQKLYKSDLSSPGHLSFGTFYFLLMCGICALVILFWGVLLFEPTGLLSDRGTVAICSAVGVAGFSMASLALSALGVDGTRETLWYFVGAGTCWALGSVFGVITGFFSKALSDAKAGLLS